jgi:SAM-dependent methyltransferase
MTGPVATRTSFLRRRFNPEEPELMDRPGALDAEWRRDLANLRSLNRYFGSYRIVRWFLRPRWCRGRRTRILDLATGSADVPAMIADDARAQGMDVAIDAVEKHPATLAAAREHLGGRYPEIALHHGDVRSFDRGPGRGGGYDLVLCSLALHHFSEDDAVAILQNALAWARADGGSVLVADLERSLWCAAGVYAITATVYREPMTVTDARMSVHAAFTKEELCRLARRAGWGERVRHRRFLVGGRQAIWIDT